MAWAETYVPTWVYRGAARRPWVRRPSTDPAFLLRAAFACSLLVSLVPRLGSGHNRGHPA